MQPVGGTPIHGYSRSEVDDFLNAAAAERARLESSIADAQARAGRARAALGMHRVMVAMLLETQREIAQLRTDAEHEAEAIIAAAERDVVSARVDRPAMEEIDLSVVDVSKPSLPLVQWPTPSDGVADPQSPMMPMSTSIGDGTANGDPRDDGDEYFAFLRGALDDDEPLGPRPTQ